MKAKTYRILDELKKTSYYNLLFKLGNCAMEYVVILHKCSCERFYNTDMFMILFVLYSF